MGTPSTLRPRPGATERWEHGQLAEVETAERLAVLEERWGAYRTADARVGALTVHDISDRDREAMARFCARGWQRILVQLFEHVGAKAAHVGRLDDGLRSHGTLGASILAARTRHRLAVLEELLHSRGEDVLLLFSELDRLDQTLDGDLGDSWLMSELPDHCASLWPLRNLMRLADRRGVILRNIAWQEYESESSYAPEVPVLSLEPRIYGAGVEHDITHYLEPVFWTRDQLTFEVANNGIEGDGQAMNNLILSSRYSGPVYEGFAGWPGAQLFEWLERAFQVATFPQMFGALRMFTIVMHQGFDGDPVAKLRELAPGLKEGDHLNDLLGFFPEYVQHDHDFLGVLHARYVTPFYDLWREHVNSRLTFDLEVHVQTADDFLWDHQDVDLRYWWHPAIGRVGCAKARCRHLWTRALELQHLAERTPGYSGSLEVLESLDEGIGALVGVLVELATSIDLHVLHTPPGAREPSVLEGHERDLVVHTAKLETLREGLTSVASELRAAEPGGEGPSVEIPKAFPEGYVDLFAGSDYEVALHEGSDLEPSGVSLDGARRRNR
jgi:hypothetical protein